MGQFESHDIPLARIRLRSSPWMLCHPFSLTVPRTEPELDDQRVDGEANPERDPEKLLWLKMCQTAGGKEYAHHRTRSDDSKKNRYCPYHPSPLQKQLAASPMKVGTEQRDQKKRVKEQDRRALHPSAHGINAHGISGKSDYCTQRE